MFNDVIVMELIIKAVSRVYDKFNKIGFNNNNNNKKSNLIKNTNSK